MSSNCSVITCEGLDAFKRFTTKEVIEKDDKKFVVMQRQAEQSGDGWEGSQH